MPPSRNLAAFYAQPQAQTLLLRQALFAAVPGYKPTERLSGLIAGKSGLLDYVSRDASVDDAQHSAHDGRASSEQEVNDGEVSSNFTLLFDVYCRL
jgi:hypothetical protein